MWSRNQIFTCTLCTTSNPTKQNISIFSMPKLWEDCFRQSFSLKLPLHFIFGIIFFFLKASLFFPPNVLNMAKHTENLRRHWNVSTNTKVYVDFIAFVDFYFWLLPCQLVRIFSFAFGVDTHLAAKHMNLWCTSIHKCVSR